MRPLEEIRFQGYVYENMTVTDNGFAYIILTDDIIKKKPQRKLRFLSMIFLVFW